MPQAKSPTVAGDLPAAPTTPTAPPATPPASAPLAPGGSPAAPGEGVHDVLLANILKSLRPEQEPPVEPAVEPPAEPPATPPAEQADAGTGGAGASAEAPPAPAQPTADPNAPVPPAQPAPPAPRRKKKVSIGKGHPVVDNPPPPAPASPAPTPVPPAPPAPAAEAPLATGSLPVDEEELAEAAVAERLFGDRYKGHTTALKKWYQDFDSRVAALRAQNPNVAEQDDEYQALLDTKPAIKPADYKKVAKTLATEAAVQETNQRLAPKLDKLEMDTRRAEILPGVQDFTQRIFGQGVRQLIQADNQSCLHEPMKLALEKGIEAAMAEFPEESTIMRETMDAQKKRVHEFLLLKNRATAFDPKNTTHQEIANLINEESRNLMDYGARNGIQHLVKDGRQFMPRDQFIALLGSDAAEGRTFNPAQWTTQRYWTFTDTAIVDMMAIRAKNEAENRINYERDRANRLGYVKPPRKSVANPQPTGAGAANGAGAAVPAAVAPPKVTPSAVPAPSRPAKPQIVDNSPIPVATVAGHLKVTK